MSIDYNYLEVQRSELRATMSMLTDAAVLDTAKLGALRDIDALLQYIQTEGTGANLNPVESASDHSANIADSDYDGWTTTTTTSYTNTQRT